MLQHSEPNDFVVATGEAYSVKEFLEVSFSRVGLDWQKYVEVDPRYFRPAEVDLLIGDASKAKAILGWEPTHSLQDLVSEMVRSDLKVFHRERFLKEGGFEVKAQYE
jgi:GDPmannose 4,6-dehydratase